ncbi:hypothetical protein [Oceanobacillus neutriphilus]|uniref:Beta-carotene 15,15'-monooxygenase n=1 Tax=Oceanobacillus neutriphilus TaxID=531815 RepID=A0ABQ2NPQ1_9BACI|nr:hypothetical protein [Oceanobacillus neutriphilus]GGP08641.1 hypothetical protein GCM10011346_09490 [Oceanobacillus neutriphilus]
MKGNRLRIPLLLIILSMVMISSYIILRLSNINSMVVILLTLTLIILCPLSIYFFLILPGSMPKILLYLSFIICLGLSYFIIPSSQKYFFNQILVWLLPIVQISVIIFVVYSIAKGIIRYKEINSNGSYTFLEAMRKLLEPKLGKGFFLEAVITEISILYYAVLVWFKKINISGNEFFTYHKTSMIKTIVIVFSIIIVLEGALFHFVIQWWSTIAAWIFTVLNIYALFYLVGLYSSARFLPHVIGQNSLIIRLGYQSSIELNIENIESIKYAKQQGGIGDKIPKDTYYSLLSMDPPQYEIILKEPVMMQGSYGRKKQVKTVVFRSDEPNKMIDRINRIREQSSNEIG